MKELLIALIPIDKISTFSTLLLIIFYLIFHKRNKDKKFWIIFVYVVLSYFADRLNVIFKPQRFYISSFFTLIEFSIFSYFFYLIYKEKSSKRILFCCIPIFFTTFLYSMTYNYGFQFDYLPSSAEGIIMIIFSILFFYEQMIYFDVNFIYSSKSFWIIVGFLIYTSATSILFIASGVATLTTDETNNLWLFNNVGNLIKNIFFAIAFVKPLIMSIDISYHRLNRTK